MKNKKLLYLIQGALIAALYIVLTYICNALGFANGVIQVRISEALTILPFFTPSAIGGLFVGCFLSNLLTGCVVYDIVFGSIATLIGAIGTYLLGKKKWLAPIPPIIANVIIVPIILRYFYGFEQAYPYLMATIGIGEVISCGILGMCLLLALEPYKKIIFHLDGDK